MSAFRTSIGSKELSSTASPVVFFPGTAYVNTINASLRGTQTINNIASGNTNVDVDNTLRRNPPLKGAHELVPIVSYAEPAFDSTCFNRTTVLNANPAVTTNKPAPGTVIANGSSFISYTWESTTSRDLATPGKFVGFRTSILTINNTDEFDQGTYTCTSTAGTSSVVIKTQLADATVIKSAPFTATCGGAAATYTASFDKASYVQGEVAVLTIAWKDSRGFAANSEDAVDTITSNASNMSISAPMLAQVGAFTAATKPGLAGTTTVNFTVGTSSGLTEGSYNAVVNVPNLNTLGKAQSVPYKVTTGSTTVSNAEVLKSIVALIASINKQIQALQKLILKR